MDFVNVAVRIKPSSNENVTVNNILEVICEDPPTLHIVDRHQAYTFDKIFDHRANQVEIFDSLIHPLVEKTILGYNCTAFAYGQTGTGKTYTLGSDMKELQGQNVGIIKRVFESIFSKVSDPENIEIQLSVCEVYQEKVYDLLANNKTALTVKGINTTNLTLQKVNDINSAEKMLLKSCKRRHIGETKQNAWSSRSHAVFTIYVNIKNEDGTRSSKLNLVDLAGCESIKKTDTQDNQLNEAIKINMGLLSVGLVISALTLNKTCIPYRQSMLTRILYDSLNKQSYITLMACVSSSPLDLHDTIQTLDFALKTKKVKSKPQLNNILMKNSKSIISNHSDYITMHNIKTPMKRPNPYMHTSTSIQRFKVSSTIHHRQNSQNILKSSLDIVSPIAKTVINKLEKDCSNNTELSIQTPEFYNTIYKLVQEEVHLQTNELSTTNIPSAEVNVKDVNETSSIFHISRDALELFRINSEDNEAENKENLEGTNKNTIRTNIGHTSHFKVPELPMWCSSPCEINSATSRKSTLNHPRRSVRLSMKRISMNNLPSESFNSKKKLNTRTKLSNQRSSTCSMKDELNSIDIEKSNTIMNDSRGGGIDMSTNTRKNTSQEDIFDENTIKIFPVFAQRRSIRLSIKRSLASTLTNQKNGRDSYRISRSSSVSKIAKKMEKVEMHKLNILQVLNKGDIKELQKLHTVGPKTAEQIYLFRKLNGPFKMVHDLEQILYQGKSYERFLTANCLNM
ncbi:hypothetical protein Trydic_g16273 [Trypoxylus dichotomus]